MAFSLNSIYGLSRDFESRGQFAWSPRPATEAGEAHAGALLDSVHVPLMGDISQDPG
jgi:hypothetical protein